MGPLPGAKPGTRQYIVQLKSRGFDPKQVIALAIAQKNPVVRQQMIASLGPAAANDQVDIKLAVETLGGRMGPSFWCHNACLAELDTVALHALARNSRVKRIWPNEARGPASLKASPSTSPPLPLNTSGNPNNHNYGAAWFIPPFDTTRTQGKGTIVAFFDSGLDSDDSSGSPHFCFDLQTNAAVTRLLGSYLVPGTMSSAACGTLPAVDCNDPTVHPFTYAWVFPNWVMQTHRDARHGTGMASITLGFGGTGSGHAPDAHAVGFSITRGFASPASCLRWQTDDAAYLTAIQMLIAWHYDSLDQGTNGVNILNVSFDGWPDPLHPVNNALDEIAVNQNILVVVSASNNSDTTVVAFAPHNAISVGAVEKRFDAGVPLTPTWYSARGPLVGQRDRFYPDVCAVGGTDAQPFTTRMQVAHVDSIQVPSSQTTFFSIGTSDAAAQVSGAAALYISRRLPIGLPTVIETRAAILASVADPYVNQPNALDTYTNRNAFGVGFVRDDYLVDFSERFGATNTARIGPPLAATSAGEVVTLPPAPSQTDVAWAGLSTSDDHVVAIAWNSGPEYAGAEPPSNLDLEIWDTSPVPVRLAQSASLFNSFERVVFRPTTSTVTIRTIHRTGPIASSAVAHIAARKHPEAHANKHAVVGIVETIPQPACAPANNVNQTVSRVVPSTYTQAYGSGFFNPQAFTFSAQPHHFIYQEAVVGGSMIVNGLALRTWKPFNNSGITNNDHRITINLLGLAHAPTGSMPGHPIAGFSGTYPAGVQVAGPSLNVNIAPPPANRFSTGATTWSPVSALHWETWNIRIPFSSPFVYDPAANPQDRDLAIWWDATWFGGTANTVGVDGINDGTTTPVFLRRPSDGTWLQGLGPIFGLVPSGTSSPRLDLHGEPSTDEWMWFMAHGFLPQPPTTPPASTMVLALGFSSANAPFAGLDPNCIRNLTSMDILLPMSWPSSTGVADYGIRLPAAGSAASLLYRDLWFQSLEVINGVVVQASNAVRARIGGRL